MSLDLGQWFILTMASPATLAVAQALSAHGVWTPQERQMARLPRSRSRPGKPVPIMPGFAFAPVDQLERIQTIAALQTIRPVYDGPAFRLFRHNGGYPLVTDEALAPLRLEEARRANVFARLRRRGMAKPEPLPAGTTVRPTDGAFAGMTGTVEETRGNYTLVAFTDGGKRMEVSIASLLLQPDAASIGQTAALAA